jgi:hypothetical protein
VRLSGGPLCPAGGADCRLGLWWPGLGQVGQLKALREQAHLGQAVFAAVPETSVSTVRKADVVVTELRHDLADAGQAVEDVGLVDELLNDLPGVLPGAVGNEIPARASTSAAALPMTPDNQPLAVL